MVTADSVRIRTPQRVDNRLKEMSETLLDEGYSKKSKRAEVGRSASAGYRGLQFNIDFDN